MTENPKKAKYNKPVKFDQFFNNDVCFYLFLQQEKLKKDYYYSSLDFLKNKYQPSNCQISFLSLRNKIIRQHRDFNLQETGRQKKSPALIQLKLIHIQKFQKIQHYQKTLKQLSDRLFKNFLNYKQFNQKEPNSLQQANQYDCIKDIYKEEKQYIFHLKQKNIIERQQNIEKFQNSKPLKNNEQNFLKRIVCQVCNSDQDSEDNLIVYCSLCCISCHQACIGLHKIPQDDWICQACLKYGSQGRYLSCMLCSQKGGALFETDVPVNSPLLLSINKSYYQKMNENEKTPDNFYEQNKEKILNDFDQLENEILSTKEMRFLKFFKDIENQKVIKVLYKSFAQDYLQLNQETKLEPITKNIWMHYSCAFWNCIKYKNFNFYKIFSFQKNNQSCLICNQQEGNCIKCYCKECQKYFHAECGRRMFFGMYERKEKPNCIIFCPEHMPISLKFFIKKSLILKQHQIKKFYNELSKYYENVKFKKLNKIEKYYENLKKIKKIINYCPQEIKTLPQKYQVIYLSVNHYYKNNQNQGIIINLQKNQNDEYNLLNVEFYYHNAENEIISKSDVGFWEKMSRILGMRKFKIHKKYCKIQMILKGIKQYRNSILKTQKYFQRCNICRLKYQKYIFGSQKNENKNQQIFGSICQNCCKQQDEKSKQFSIALIKTQRNSFELKIYPKLSQGQQNTQQVIQNDDNTLNSKIQISNKAQIKSDHSYKSDNQNSTLDQATPKIQVPNNQVQSFLQESNFQIKDKVNNEDKNNYSNIKDLVIKKDSTNISKQIENTEINQQIFKLFGMRLIKMLNFF